jgi:plastocyanin
MAHRSDSSTAAHPWPRPRGAAITAAVLALLLGSWGGNPPAPRASGASTISEAADPHGALRYTASSLFARAGRVIAHFTDDSPVPHNMTIRRGTHGPVVAATPTFKGGTRTLRVTLKPGPYTLYCSVPGDRAAGMHGTLEVSRG